MKTMFILPLFSLIAMAFFQEKLSAQEIAIIINAESPVPEKFTLDYVKNIFTGKTKVLGKTVIAPCELSEEKALTSFLVNVLNMQKSAYKSLWVKKVFGEGAKPPKAFEKAEEMLKFVSETKGAIGFLLEKDVKGKEEKIKIILTVGKEKS